MMKASRFTAFILAVAMICGMISFAAADVVTLGIYFCGKRTAEDGTETVVRLEGKFVVTRNGEEAGVIQAGKTTLTLPGTERIRIAPMPETISPEWDLRTAYMEVTPEAGGTTTVSVVVWPLKEGEPLPETPAPEQDQPENPDQPDQPDEPDDPDAAEPEVTPEPAVQAGPVTTPTLPPFDASILAPTPEPDWKPLDSGTAGISVCAYGDGNTNGSKADDENGVKGVIVCLFTENEDPVESKTTGEDGTVNFTNLPAGKYRIKAILPDGWAFGQKGTEAKTYASIFSPSIEGEAMSDAFAIGDGDTAYPGIALNRCLHVSGTCWFDTNGDGLFSKGEPVLPGVKLSLDGEKNGLHYETISGEDGSWKIDRVKAAAYQLTAYVPDGMMFTRTASRGGKKSVITRSSMTSASVKEDLNDKESKDNLYIGFIWAGMVKGRCFLDANYNGLYDEGELPMPGVKVTAIKQAQGEEVAVTFSGEDGTYVLPLRGNTYKMRAVLPDDGSDFTKTVSDPLGNHFASRPNRRENFWPDFVLASSEQREMNVGVIYPASVTGYVYEDKDFSASRSDREKIVSGYLVKLLDESGAVVAQDKTSIKGKYELTGLPPGNYSLSVTALKGTAFTKLGEGNVILNRTNGEGYSEVFSLSIGENKTGMDIGMINPGTVRGSVFADKNDNGVRDDGENGLAGVTVRLIGEEGEAFSTVIGEDGNYLFDAVMPGTYYLTYELPEHAIFARVTNGGNAITGDKTGRSEDFTMSSGLELIGPVCGALTLGRIEGSAYQDHNGNGLVEKGDEAAEGVTITLTPSRRDLDEITVTTDATGSFLLEDLHPDTWTLKVSCPDRHVVSRTDNLELPLTPGKTEEAVELPVPMGKVWTDQKLGIVIPASLSGQLWLDENNDGLFNEGESTPAGYEITVIDDATGKVFDTLRTDSEGRFGTSGMIPGSFTLTFPLDDDTIAPKHGNSDFQEEGGQLVLSGIELAEDEVRTGILLGIVKYTSIGGSVWIDRGDSIEPLAGAQVILKDEDGEELGSVTTADSGKYQFDHLMPGTYSLEAAMPEGCVIIEPDDPRLSGGQISVMTNTTNRNGSTDPFELKMAENQMQMNIGCVLPGRLGDFCWLDLDGDGLQGMYEPGIPNVKIALQRDGETLAETTTDQYGFYRFNDLYPARYTLLVTPPAEVKPTVHRTDIRMIASVLEEAEDNICVSVPVEVESDKANYNADLGFVCRKPDVLPDGIGEGKTQDWTKKYKNQE